MQYLSTKASTSDGVGAASAHADNDNDNSGVLHARDGGQQRGEHDDDEGECDESGASLKTVKQSKEVRRWRLSEPD